MRTSRISPLALAGALLLLASATFASRTAIAAAGASESLPYTGRVLIGIEPAPCDTCPPEVCAGHPIPVRVEGAFPNACWRVRKVELVPSPILVIAPPTLRVLLDDRACFEPVCIAHPTPWAVDTVLPLLPPGEYRLEVQVVLVSCTDSFPPDSIHRERFAFRCAAICPPGEILPYVDHVQIGADSCLDCPPVVCEWEPFPVTLSGLLPDDCVEFRGITLIPVVNMGIRPGPPIVRATFAFNDCMRRVCVDTLRTWTQTVVLPGLPAGGNGLTVQSQLVSMCDSTRVVLLEETGFPFMVQDTCPGRPRCLLYDWAPRRDAGGCNASFLNDTAGVDFRVASPVALAALQGLLKAGPGVEVRGLHPIGPASGMSLQWLRTETGASFVMFAPDGVPIPPYVPSPDDTVFDFVPVLRVEVRNIPYVTFPEAPPRTVFTLYADSLLGADSLGGGVRGCLQRCPDPTDPRCAFPPVANFCIQSHCDANHDGRRDVRDLVLLVRCLAGADCYNPAARFDCDGNDLFDLQDVVCCAMAILRGHERPDATRPDPAIALGFGEPVRSGDLLEVPFTLAGADRVGAARVELRFPSDRYDVEAFGMPGDPPGWLAVHDVQDGELVIGLVALDASQAGPTLPLSLRLRLRAGAEHGGELVASDADVSAADGVVLETSIAGTGAVLDPWSAIALSAVRPNPAAADARFTLSLPRASEVDLTVHDLAGRRVATLHRGALAAGVHPFAWNARTDRGEAARDGVYFIRLRAGGVEIARKTVLVRGR